MHSRLATPRAALPLPAQVSTALLFLALCFGSGPARLSAAVVAHWPFDEASGTNAQDVVGAAHGGLSGAGAMFVPDGVSGGAVRLDRAQNGYVQMPPMPGLVSSNFSIALWAKLSAGDVTENSYLLTLHEAWFQNGAMIGVNQATAGAPGKAWFYAGANAQMGTSATSINDGAWHQVVLVYDRNGQSSLYVDGGAAEASVASAIIGDRSPPLLIGGVYGMEFTGVAKGFLTGWVDDLQVYDQALTEAEVGQLYAHPGSSLADLVIRFDPPGGRFVGSVDVRLTSTVAGSTIRYTTDGGEPVATSAAYTGSVTLDATSTLKARLFLDTFPVSEVMSAAFTRVAPVDFLPPGGAFTNALAVSLFNNVGMGSVRFTTDGTEPVVGSALSSGPLTLTNATTVKARVFVNGFPVHETCTASYSRVYAVDDGVPNAWRERFFGAGYATDPRVGAEADPDGDGWSNLLEYRADTDPLDKASAPKITAGIRAFPRVDWNTVPGLSYRVLRKSDSAATNWTEVLPSFLATETNSFYLDGEAPATAIYLIERLP